MLSNEEMETELTELRTNADNLSHCLHALLERIEQLEGLTGQELSSMKKPAKNGVSEPTSDVQVVKSETVAVDPLTGLKKKTVVTERILTTKTFHAVAKLPSSTGSPEPLESEHLNATLVNGHLPLLGRAYEARLVDVRADQLKQLEVEQICGEMVVTKVHPDIAGTINPGDTLLEINGKPVKTRKDLFAQVGTVQAKVVIADVYNAPTEFVKALANYDSEKDETRPTNLPIHLGQEKRLDSSKKSQRLVKMRVSAIVFADDQSVHDVSLRPKDPRAARSSWSRQKDAEKHASGTASQPVLNSCAYHVQGAQKRGTGRAGIPLRNERVDPEADPRKPDDRMGRIGADLVRHIRRKRAKSDEDRPSLCPRLLRQSPGLPVQPGIHAVRGRHRSSQLRRTSANGKSARRQPQNRRRTQKNGRIPPTAAEIRVRKVL
uniref:PDZ domain-containing protein n=1 Tax=Panagrolaimus sp. JU765 TaxID=591449 RepID=A0AC34QRW3_9BILA